MTTSTLQNIVKSRILLYGLLESSTSTIGVLHNKFYSQWLPNCLHTKLSDRVAFILCKGHRSILISLMKQIEATKQTNHLYESSDNKSLINHQHIRPFHSHQRSNSHSTYALCSRYPTLISCRIDDSKDCSNSRRFYKFKNTFFYTSCTDSMTNRNKLSTTSCSSSDINKTSLDHDALRAKKLQDQWRLDLRGVRRQGINTCRGLYVKWQQTRPKLYKNAPRNGIYFDVEYYDSEFSLDSSSFDDEKKVIVMLHGAPGTYNDFASQITYFTQKGYRVIAPNFPDYSARVHKFRHSTKERYYYMEDFFRAINLTRIHLLIGHSAAVYVLFELLEKSQYLKIDAVGMLNNPGYRLPKQLQVTWIRMFFLELYEHDFLRPILQFMTSLFLRVQGIVNRADKLDNLLLAASCIGYSEHSNLERQYKLIHSKKIPAFIVISDRDKLIPSEYYQMVLDSLNITAEQVNCYDDLGNLIKGRSDRKDHLQVVKFTSGGHYSFQSSARIVNKEMEGFLKICEGKSKELIDE